MPGIYCSLPGEAGRKSDPTNWNGGTDRRYEGPLFTKLQAAPAPVGKLIAWNPIEKREVWHLTHPGVESAGVLASAGDLVFQGRSDGIFLAYRATDGEKLWEYDTGTGILAPPVSYMLDGVQYITVMVGWGGDLGTKNFPKWGISKPGSAGFSRLPLVGVRNWKFLALATAAHPSQRFA